MDANEMPIQKLSIPLMPRLALYVCMAGVLAVGLVSYVYNYIQSLSTGM